MWRSLSTSLISRLHMRVLLISHQILIFIGYDIHVTHISDLLPKFWDLESITRACVIEF
jgi:hypothetical protein